MNKLPVSNESVAITALELFGELSDDDSVNDSVSEIDLDIRSEKFPLCIKPDGHIILKLFSSTNKHITEFLISIAEHIRHIEHSHEYKLTAFSLYSAMSIGLKTQSIIDGLQELSKTCIPSTVIDFIKLNTMNYGMLKLELKLNRYFVKSSSHEIIVNLLRDAQIRECRLMSKETHHPDSIVEHEPCSMLCFANDNSLIHSVATTVPLENNDMIDIDGAESEKSSQDASRNLKSYSFEIIQERIELLRKRCYELGYPLAEEYDFRHDLILKNLNIELRPDATLRPYQEESLRKICGNGCGRSGLIILPCGAGKSLVGVAAACTINKSCLVLCNSSVSVLQWKEQFLKWSTASNSQIRLLMSEKKNEFIDPCIYISTYQMIASTNVHNIQTSKIMKQLKNHEWSLMLLDEVHITPATTFRKVLSCIHAHIKVGLTATLVREDRKIKDLQFLIGPKLYEANWMELENAGFIAKAYCAEVRCKMTSEFLLEYKRTSHDIIRRRLQVLNPNKFRACQYLIEYHEQRNEKIIVFCDDLFALETYALKLNKPLIRGEVAQRERLIVLENFQRNSLIKTIFLSRVGDTSFDLPEATVIIQISSHGSSRRQEAQRLGRILRTKMKTSTEDNNAFFYALVSEDTDEVHHQIKRESFLTQQGYSYKVMSNPVTDEAQFHYSKEEEQRDLLKTILTKPLQNNDKNIKKASTTREKSRSKKYIHPLFKKYRK